LTRNFREETVTDLLMASLVGLEPFGVRVDFPDEPTTGGDMDWIYAAPLEINGGRYLRLILQAKRAKFAKLKTGGYWYYQHLDHGTPAGQQAQTLMAYASSSPGGMSTLPLYILYHPRSTLAPAVSGRPDIEGINLIFASNVASVVLGGCTRHEKKVDYWRDGFMPLSDILCWPVVVGDPRAPPPLDATRFIVGPTEVALPNLAGGFHPDIVARRLQYRRERAGIFGPQPETPLPPIEAADGIPNDIRRAIDGHVTPEDRKALERPRVVLSTRIRREDPDFPRAEIQDG
jgi:hypothetical protein